MLPQTCSQANLREAFFSLEFSPSQITLASVRLARKQSREDTIKEKKILNKGGRGRERPASLCGRLLLTLSMASLRGCCGGLRRRNTDDTDTRVMYTQHCAMMCTALPRQSRAPSLWSNFRLVSPCAHTAEVPDDMAPAAAARTFPIQKTTPWKTVWCPQQSGSS